MNEVSVDTAAETLPVVAAPAIQPAQEGDKVLKAVQPEAVLAEGPAA